MRAPSNGRIDSVLNKADMRGQTADSGFIPSALLTTNVSLKSPNANYGPATSSLYGL